MYVQKEKNTHTDTHMLPTETIMTPVNTHTHTHPVIKTKIFHNTWLEGCTHHIIPLQTTSCHITSWYGIWILWISDIVCLESCTIYDIE